MPTDWRKSVEINDRSERALTMTGGISFEVWFYILLLENVAHEDPLGEMMAGDWREFYEDDYTPHDALEEDFASGSDATEQ